MATNFLLAMDDSECSHLAAREILDHVRADAATVHVLHVLELDRMVRPAMDFARGREYGPDVVASVRTSREEAEQLVNGVAQRLQDAQFRTATAVREGDPAHQILDYAAECECDCIVVGSHGRRGLDRLVMGSVSAAVSRHARCSVYVVRPRTRRH
jgi:nucleotide-binding universal stress UspA family protein